VIRSDSGVTHRLSLSARVVSAVNSQVKRNDNGRSASDACRISLPHTGASSAKRQAQGWSASALNPQFNPGVIHWHGLPPIPDGLEAKSLFALPGAMVVPPSGTGPQEVQRYCHHRVVSPAAAAMLGRGGLDAKRPPNHAELKIGDLKIRPGPRQIGPSPGQRRSGQRCLRNHLPRYRNRQGAEDMVRRRRQPAQRARFRAQSSSSSSSLSSSA
jgi:hypothetical protein